jgi:glycerol kinase
VARCDELKEAGHEPLVRERTGLVLDPYFSGTKIEWLLKEGGVPAGAAFGTIDSWLVFKLTGEHVTDFSNASRTLLFDIGRREWTASSASCSAWSPGHCPSRAPAPRCTATRSGRAGGGHRRRPAGGAIRPGLPRAGAR